MRMLRSFARRAKSTQTKGTNMGFEKMYSRVGKLYDAFARRKRVTPTSWIRFDWQKYWDLSDASRKYARLMNWTAGF